MTCFVKHCKAAKKDGISLHRFPTDKTLFEKWVELVGDPGSRKLPRVCGVHFKSNSFESDLRSELLGIPKVKILKPGALPTEKLCSSAESEYFYLLVI